MTTGLGDCSLKVHGSSKTQGAQFYIIEVSSVKRIFETVEREKLNPRNFNGFRRCALVDF